MKTVKIDLKDLYQFLISECRYGYTRNNHLMPDGAYNHVKEYLPKIAEQDKEYAIYVAKQLCEECISNQLVTNFYDGEDDEFENRAEAIEFINWLLEFIDKGEFEFKGDSTGWTPYNYYEFKQNLEKDNDKLYNVYELNFDGSKHMLAGPLSVKEFPEFVFRQVTENEFQGVTFRKMRINDDYAKPVSFKYEIITPVERTFIVEHI